MALQIHGPLRVADLNAFLKAAAYPNAGTRILLQQGTYDVGGTYFMTTIHISGNLTI